MSATVELAMGGMAFLSWLKEQGYQNVRVIDHNRYACTVQYMFTCAIVTGTLGNMFGFDDRWCYATADKAESALAAWDGIGEPTGWHRHPASGRRVATTMFEVDETTGRQVEIGETYVNR